MEFTNENDYIKAYEYEKNVNPTLQSVPIFSKNINDCDYGLNLLDLRSKYNIDYNATTPNLLANFIKLKEGEKYTSTNHHLYFNSCSHFFYIMQSSALITINNNPYKLFEGDIFIYPFFHYIEIENKGKSDLHIYYINDSPLINYLGSKPYKQIFKPAIYTKEFIFLQMANLSNPNNNRKGILLSNSDTEKIGINTITPVLWSLFNELPPNTNQKPHKHNSVALDLCIQSLDCENIYTLIGEEIDTDGNIINPKKIHWKTGEMFTTPPGLWHSHHNEGSTYAYILPIQDAGLLLYQRILGIEIL
jgi:gentisate 1,2-dioxygenase